MKVKDFVEMAVDEVMRYLPEEAKEDLRIEPVEVTKMNDRKLHGMSFRHGDDPAPTLYLDETFREFEQGRELQEMMQELPDSYLAIGPVKTEIVKPDLSKKRMHTGRNINRSYQKSNLWEYKAIYRCAFWPAGKEVNVWRTSRRGRRTKARSVLWIVPPSPSWQSI